MYSFAGSEHKLEAAFILVWLPLFQIKGDCAVFGQQDREKDASISRWTYFISSSKETNGADMTEADMDRKQPAHDSTCATLYIYLCAFVKFPFTCAGWAVIHFGEHAQMSDGDHVTQTRADPHILLKSTCSLRAFLLARLGECCTWKHSNKMAKELR